MEVQLQHFTQYLYIFVCNIYTLFLQSQTEHTAVGWNKDTVLMNAALIPSSSLIMKEEMYPTTAEINQQA